MRRFLLWFLPMWEGLKEKVFTDIRPGFRGPVPYVLPLRYLFLLVIVLRAWLYPVGTARHAWLALILSSAILTAIATYLARTQKKEPSAGLTDTNSSVLTKREWFYSLVILADICLISWAYWLTADPTSGILLLYCLPVFTAAEHAGPTFFVVVVAVTEAFIIITTSLLQPAQSIHGLLDAVFNRAAIRGSFLLSIAFVTSSVIRVERSLRKRLDRRDEQFQVLLDFKEEADKVLDTDKVLSLAVDKAIRLVSSDGVTVGAGLLVNSNTRDVLAAYSNPRELLETDGGKALVDQVAQQHSEGVQNYLKNEHRPSWPYSKRVIHASLCVPILSRYTPIGLLFLRRIGRYTFNHSDEWFLQAIAGNVATTIERLRLTSALDSLSAALPSALELDRQLDYVLSELTEGLGFDFATISLVDEYRGVVETVRGRNVPLGWLSRAKHKLDENAIQSDVVRSRKTYVIGGGDPRFASENFSPFEHAKLARVFAPIICDEEVVGTVEAGCSLDRKDEVITPPVIEAVERIGRERGRDMGRTRPHALLEMIVESAISIIGADSASVHVYRKKHGAAGLGDLILAAGAGKATKEFIRAHPPRPDGLGHRAMRDREVVTIDDPQELARRSMALFRSGVRSMAAFPLTFGEGVHGALYVHFWDREHRFSASELDLGRLFTRQMEVVVQNHLLIRSTTELAARAWELSRMQNLMQSLASPFDLRGVLEKVAENVLMMVDADNVTLYQYDSDSDQFVTPPVMKGKFYDVDSMLTGIHPQDTPRWALQQGGPRFFPGIPDQLRSGRPDGRSRFAVREKIASCAIVPLRAGREKREFVGLLFVNYRSPREFNLEDQNIINVLADSAALVIRTARLYEPSRRELERRKRELQALRAVDQAIIKSAPDLGQVLQLILAEILEITKAQSGEFMLLDPKDKTTLISEARLPAGLPRRSQAIEQGIIGLAARSGRSVLAGDVRSEPHFLRVTPDTRSELAVPLFGAAMREEGKGANHDLIGVLDIESNLTNRFTLDDKLLMETLAVQAVIAIHSVDLYNTLERRIRRIKHLGALNTIATRIQERPYDLDTILHLILTGITSGDGLGFSRAMLFLADEGGFSLRGHVAIGALSGTEAERIWKSLQGEPVRSAGLESELSAAEQFVHDLHNRKIVEFPPLGAAIRQVSLRIDDSEGAIAQCLSTGKTIRVGYGQSDAFRDIMRQLTRPNDLDHAFACVPLAGKQTKRVGALVVDNRFLSKEGEVDEEDIVGLEAFARMLALSVENALLAEQQIESARVVTAGIAHTVGTRLSATAGQVTRLRSSLETVQLGDAATEVRLLLDRLTDGVERADMVLQEFRTFTAPSQLQLKEMDLKSILADVFQDKRENCRYAISLPDEPLPALVDSFKLANALMEIIKNAHEAALTNSHVAQIELKATAEQSSDKARQYARIEITDNGQGISDEKKERVFKPFFSTKKGTGLGLAIAKNVFDGHGGTVQVEDNPAGGARFVIRIPLTGRMVAG